MPWLQGQRQPFVAPSGDAILYLTGPWRACAPSGARFARHMHLASRSYSARRFERAVCQVFQARPLSGLGACYGTALLLDELRRLRSLPPCQGLADQSPEGLGPQAESEETWHR